MGLLLYTFAPQDRSGKIRWIFEELGLSYELKTLDGEKDEHKNDEYKKIHPFSMVPVIKDGESTIFESGAIAVYLADKYSNSTKLAPAIDSKLRGEYLKWIFLATTTLDPLLIKVFGNKNLSEEDKTKKLDGIYVEVLPAILMIEDVLKKSRYVVGNEFSSADIMLAQPLEWARKGMLLDKHPIIETYLMDLKDRPACKKSGIFG
jgi:glutathione S-transferase